MNRLTSVIQNKKNLIMKGAPGVGKTYIAKRLAYVMIETDKRGEQINLLYSNDKFSVPPNLYIIGMMNTADRSLALLDYALRRRFSFVEIRPAFENDTFMAYVNKLNNPIVLLRVIKEIKHLNHQIVEELGSGFQIGHSYFVGEAYEVNSAKRVEEVVEFEIIPQLFEYWFDDEQKAKDWAGRLRGCYDGEK